MYYDFVAVVLSGNIYDSVLWFAILYRLIVYYTKWYPFIL